MSWGSWKKVHFCTVYFVRRNFFNMCLISMYSVLNTSSEYIYFYVSKNITSFTFLLVFKIAKSFQCILKIKTNLNFYFDTSLWILKRFYEGLRFMKALIFSLRQGLWREGLIVYQNIFSTEPCFLLLQILDYLIAFAFKSLWRLLLTQMLHYYWRRGSIISEKVLHC